MDVRFINEQTIMIYFENKISEETYRNVTAMVRWIREKEILEIQDIVPSYRAVLIYFDEQAITPSKLIENLELNKFNEKNVHAVNHVSEIEKLAKDIGYPVVIKAASGGGGKGIRIVKKAEDLEKAFKEAKSEGKKYFDDDRVYVEAFIPVAKHVEVQVMGDGQDNYVHLGERDCSVQRKNQKLIEESPCAALTEERRQQICNDAVKVARAANYRSAGTIEFLVTDNAHYFIEMNARIQVEHTVTEMRAERDLVAAQLYLLEHNHLPFSQSDIQFNGHVIEARINAENPEKKFQPTPGKVTALHLPQGFNVRVDSLLYHGYQVSPYYDSLVAKVIVKSHDRASAIDKLKATLDEMVIDGFSTTADFLYAVLNYPLYRDGDAKDVDIKFLEKHQIVKGVEL